MIIAKRPRRYGQSLCIQLRNYAEAQVGHVSAPHGKWGARTHSGLEKAPAQILCAKKSKSQASSQPLGLPALFTLGSRSQANFRKRNTAMDDSIGGTQGVTGFRLQRAARPYGTELLDLRSTLARKHLQWSAGCVCSVESATAMCPKPSPSEGACA